MPRYGWHYTPCNDQRIYNIPGGIVLLALAVFAAMLGSGSAAMHAINVLVWSLLICAGILSLGVITVMTVLILRARKPRAIPYFMKVNGQWVRMGAMTPDIIAGIDRGEMIETDIKSAYPDAITGVIVRDDVPGNWN